ncbi:hypothetical protein EGW08_002821 [Elysia chlorotica]|uniref:Uncharacterized protein n=1 Tax=Elysia chlorotica TaxID=188477 RepID=A0A3S1HZU8_ELYCH|nr:hypothetical protein EGW08_002821 [Elysia chlorotica]
MLGSLWPIDSKVNRFLLDQFVRNMGKSMVIMWIRTNCVNPTVTMTQMGVYAWSDPAKSGPVLNRIPLGKFAEVEDVVNAVLFLLSDKAAYINGATLPVEGGLLVA